MKKFVRHGRMAENKSLFIIDASVVLKWFFDETKFQKEAFHIRDDFFGHKIHLLFPDYAYAEILNTMGRYLTSEQALAAFGMLLSFQIYEAPVTAEIGFHALKIMKQFPGISFYDAGYHALAINTHGIFITADQKYYDKAKAAKNIMLLKDYCFS